MDNQLQLLQARLAELGLRLRGGFDLDPALDSDLRARFPEGRSLALVGNVGGELWLRSGTAIRARGGTGPLNDWIKETLTPIAAEFGAGIVFDFEGPPYFPFQQWAQRAEPVFRSPLGILIHPVYGLWHAYRAALIFDRVLLPTPAGKGRSPCETCSAKPCLSACPVGAFDGSNYDVAGCARHLFGNGRDCREGGCLARRACPIGAEYSYASDQMSFHMDAFVESLRRRGAVE